MNSVQASLIGLSFGFFLLTLPFSGFVAILPYVQSEWQGTNVSSGIGFSTWIVGQLIAAVAVIPFIGKIEIRRLILIAAVLLLAQNMLYPYLAVNYLTNGVLRCIGGLAHLTIYVAGIQLLSNQFKMENRGRAIGIWVAASYAGSTLGMLIVGGLLDFMSWRAASLVIALPSMIGIVTFWFLLPPALDTQVNKSSESHWIQWNSINKINLWSIYLAYGLHAFELFMLRVWIPTLLAYSLLQSIGNGDTNYYNDAAVFASLMMSMGALGVYFGGYIADKIGRINAAMILFLASGICSILLGVIMGEYYLVLVIGFMAGFLTAADSSIYSTLIVELSNAQNISSNQSVQSIVGMLMGASAPVIGGLFLDFNGNDQLQYVFMITGLAAVLGVFLLFYAKRIG